MRSTQPPAEQLAAEIEDYLVRAQRCRRVIAQELCQGGTYLHCRTCGKSQAMSGGQAEGYLETRDWPMCCGKTMEMRR